MPPGVHGPPVPKASQSLLDRGKAAFQYTRDQGHLRWIGEVGNEQAAPAVKAIEQAMEGELSPTEVSELVEKIDPTLLKRMGRTDDAIGTVLAVAGTQERGTDSIERMLGADPKLVEALSPQGPGYYPYRYDPDKKPTNAQIEAAKNNLLNVQDRSTDLQKQLSALQDELQPQRNDLEKRQDEHNDAVAKYNAGQGGDPQQLNAEQEELDRLFDALAKKEQPLRDQIADSQGMLQIYDLAAAKAGARRPTPRTSRWPGRTWARSRGSSTRSPKRRPRSRTRRTGSWLPSPTG